MNAERLRTSFLAQAAEDAERTIAAANDARRERLAEAKRRGAEIVASARAAGEIDARREAARIVGAARRRARSTTLAARLELYEGLRRRALEAAAELRTKPSYAGILERLERAARSDLGASAVVELDAGEAGGVVARAGSKLVDYSLSALVDRCIETLGERVEELWR